MGEQVRYIAVVAAFITLIAVSLGCATTAALTSDNRNAYYGTPVLTDSIFAVGKPDAASAERLGNPHTIAFLGKKNTYLLFEGGDDLMQIAQGLDGNLVTLNKQGSKLYLKDKKVWGSLSLGYARKAGETFSPDELAALNRLGFSAVGKTGVYRRDVAVKGMLYPALTLPAAQSQHFIVSRELSFYNSPDTSPPPDFSKLVKVPAAIAIDVVTLPLQLAVAGLTVLAISTSHH